MHETEEYIDGTGEEMADFGVISQGEYNNLIETGADSR